MKTASHILIILIAVLVVSGATYAILQTAAAPALTGNAMELGQMEDRPAPPDLVNGQGVLSNEPDGPAGRGGLEALGQNLFKIAAMVAAVQLLRSIGRWLKRTAASLTRQDRLNPSHSLSDGGDVVKKHHPGRS